MGNIKAEIDVNYSEIFWKSMLGTGIATIATLTQIEPEVIKDLSDLVLPTIGGAAIIMTGVEVNFQMFKSKFLPEDYVEARTANGIGASIGIIAGLYSSTIYEFHSYFM